MSDYRNYVLERKSDLVALAEAIRGKSGETGTLTVPQMKTSVEGLGGGGGADTFTLEVDLTSMWSFNGSCFYVNYTSVTESGLQITKSEYIDESNNSEPFRFTVACGTFVYIEGQYSHDLIGIETEKCVFYGDDIDLGGGAYCYYVFKPTASVGQTAKVTISDVY
jgi:hypothetical protein